MCSARSGGHRAARLALFPSIKLTFFSAFKVRFYRGKPIYTDLSAVEIYFVLIFKKFQEYCEVQGAASVK